MRLGYNDNVLKEMRARIDLAVFALRGNVMLGCRQEEERADRLVEADGQIARVLCDSYNFVLAGCHFSAPEMLSDRIFILEKPPRKSFIDDRHVL